MIEDANLSPDTKDLLDAISTLNGGCSIAPEHIDSAVSDEIEKLGIEAVSLCVGKPQEFKRGF